MLQTIEELLRVVDRHPSAIRILIFTFVTLLAGGAAIWYRIRGSRVRKAMQEWEKLFAELNARVVSLYRELEDVRDKLSQAEGKLDKAMLEAEKANRISQHQKEEIERLKELVRRLRIRESQLVHQIEELEEE